MSRLFLVFGLIFLGACSKKSDSKKQSQQTGTGRVSGAPSCLRKQLSPGEENKVAGELNGPLRGSSAATAFRAGFNLAGSLDYQNVMRNCTTSP